jgi:hypothetical protein
MKLRQFCIALAATMAIGGAANAALLTSTSGANTVTDYSAPALVAFDLDLHDFSSTTLNFVLEDADLQNPLSMNALVRNLAGRGLQHFTFSLQGISFAAPGSVTPTFGTLKQVAFNSHAASMTFVTPEYAELHFGNPFAVPGRSDWLLQTSGLRAGDAFSITATVPEPATIALLLAAMAVFGMQAMRRNGGR